MLSVQCLIGNANMTKREKTDLARIINALYCAVRNKTEAKSLSEAWYLAEADRLRAEAALLEMGIILPGNESESPENLRYKADFSVGFARKAKV